MGNLLAERHNHFWHDYKVVVAAGTSAGIGLEALPPVRKAIGSGFETKTITLSCGKLTTGVTVAQWSSILMLRNLKSPETYFQAAFRVQSPWSIKNPNGDNPNEEEILKPVCFVFDFAPTRALRQLSEYGIGLSPNEPNPENAVKDLVSFLPVLAFDGANMMQIDAGGILDIAMAGTSATLLARKWESALLVNVDNDTLRRIMDNPEAMAAVERIEGWRSLGDNIIETIINKSEKVKELKNKAKDKDLSAKEKMELTAEEKEYKSNRKLVQAKLIKFATRIPAFMYLTDFRENTLRDVITKLEPDLFLAVRVLSPVRTFWKKATLINVECHPGRLVAGPEHLSRHWFDRACLASSRTTPDGRRPRTARSSKTSSAARRSSSTRATPITTGASTAGLASSPTMTRLPDCVRPCRYRWRGCAAIR